MKWFEPLIALAAVSLVVLPIILKIKSHKKGQSSCGCSCADCSKKDTCCANFKAYINSVKQK